MKVYGITLVAALASISMSFAAGIKSGAKTSAKSQVYSESCPETVTPQGQSGVTVKPGEFGFLCFKMEIFDDHGKIVRTGIPHRPGGMANGAVSDAMDQAAAQCESKKILLNNLDKQVKATFTCSRNFPAGFAAGGNAFGAIQELKGEITEQERKEQDENLGVGGFKIQLVSNYSCSAKVEAYCE